MMIKGGAAAGLEPEGTDVITVRSGVSRGKTSILKFQPKFDLVNAIRYWYFLSSLQYPQYLNRYAKRLSTALNKLHGMHVLCLK